MCPPSVCEPPPRQPLSQAIEDASVVYGHRVLPSSLRDDLPAIDNSWGAYGAEDDAADDDDRCAKRQAPRLTLGGQVTHRAGVREVARPRRRRAQPPRPGAGAPRRDRRDRRRSRPCTSSTSPCRTVRGCCRARARHVVLARADHRSRRTRLRVRGPPRLPAPRHAGRRGRRDGRRARRPPAGAADLGRDAARRHVGPRHQPHPARHRADEGHRRQPRGGVPGAAVHQGARPGRRRDPRRQRPDDRRAPVDRRPPRCRRRLGVRRPLALRRQRRPHRADGVHRRRRGVRHRRAAGARSSRTATTGRRWPRSGRTATSSAATSPSSTVGDPSERTRRRSTKQSCSPTCRPPTATMPFVLAGTVTGGASEPPELLAAVNGPIAGVVGGYRPERRRVGVHRLRRRLLPRGRQQGRPVRGQPGRLRRSTCTRSSRDRVRRGRLSRNGRSGRACGCRSAASPRRDREAAGEGPFPVVDVVGVEHARCACGRAGGPPWIVAVGELDDERRAEVGEERRRSRRAARCW